jgi:hypothetical protein
VPHGWCAIITFERKIMSLKIYVGRGSEETNCVNAL